MIETFLKKLNKDVFKFEINNDAISVYESDIPVCKNIKIPSLSDYPTAHVYFNELPKIFTENLIKTKTTNHLIFRINYIFKNACKSMQRKLWEERMSEIGIKINS